ncbi:MAG: HNH endonuclease signature motif containing protein [candidate division NC10 bacterium]|nr:HNH endonuclease signature motif containing protein [candidate division NC10 bacterium]
MSSGFDRNEVGDLLKACHRRCCICHRFCGVKMETDHITPKEAGGTHDIENAIAVCFECHAEIHSYNDSHPRGRKYLPEELHAHKDQWLDICQRRPEIFVGVSRDADVGPLQALIDELEFNTRVAAYPQINDQGCLFHEDQFRRAIHTGNIATLDDGLKANIVEAYVSMGAANQVISTAWAHPQGSGPWAYGVNEAAKRITAALPKIEEAKAMLLEFLGSEK